MLWVHHFTHHGKFYLTLSPNFCGYDPENHRDGRIRDKEDARARLLSKTTDPRCKRAVRPGWLFCPILIGRALAHFSVVALLSFAFSLNIKIIYPIACPSRGSDVSSFSARYARMFELFFYVRTVTMWRQRPTRFFLCAKPPKNKNSWTDPASLFRRR